MKYLILACEGIADEPVEELQGRTPLEAAKTPNLDRVAREGALGTALFTPHKIPPTSDVACYSILGFDPLEFYTGVAPLEALSLGISQNDNEIAFRCDLVTALDDTLVDVSASFISDRESTQLIEALNQRLSDSKIRLHAGEGYKNILVIHEPERADELDEVECFAPDTLIGQKISKHMPRGRAAAVVSDLMTRSKDILENHEINRVRIDLNENPANMIWPWGQGRRPKPPVFKQRFGMEGAVVTRSLFLKGLARAVELRLAEDMKTALQKHDFVFLFKSARESAQRSDLKAKIKRIEEFDALAGEALKALDAFPEARLLATTDTAASLEKKTVLHGHVPLAIFGSGIERGEGVFFHEKAAAQSRLKFDEGHRLLAHFLKK